MKNTGNTGAFITVAMFAGLVASAGYAQDAEHGKSLFKAWRVPRIDDTDRLGQGWQGLSVGRRVRLADSRYSNAMKNSGMVWDAKSLQCVSRIAPESRPRNPDDLPRGEGRNG